MGPLISVGRVSFLGEESMSMSMNHVDIVNKFLIDYFWHLIKESSKKAKLCVAGLLLTGKLTKVENAMLKY